MGNDERYEEYIRYIIEEDGDGDLELTVKLLFSERWVPLNIQGTQTYEDNSLYELSKSVFMYLKQRERDRKIRDLGI